jgi:hypothetical protein
MPHGPAPSGRRLRMMQVGLGSHPGQSSNLAQKKYSRNPRTTLQEGPAGRPGAPGVPPRRCRRLRRFVAESRWRDRSGAESSQPGPGSGPGDRSAESPPRSHKSHRSDLDHSRYRKSSALGMSQDRPGCLRPARRDTRRLSPWGARPSPRRIRLQTETTPRHACFWGRQRPPSGVRAAARSDPGGAGRLRDQADRADSPCPSGRGRRRATGRGATPRYRAAASALRRALLHHPQAQAGRTGPDAAGPADRPGRQ